MKYTPIKFDDVKNQTTEDYFNNNQFSIDAFNKKYSLYPGETYVQAIWRVCQHVASVETTEALRSHWAIKWFDEIYNDWWQPAGSIMQGAGSNQNISLSNCTTLSLGAIEHEEEWDNLESIIRNTAYSVARAASYRQGLGVDFSRLRPRKSIVNNSSKEATGAIHWMRFIDSLGYYIGQAGRIPAFLFSLSITHPDVEEFIQVKGDRTIIQNANISVQITNKFYDTIIKDSNADWDLNFEIPAQKKGEKIYIDVHSSDMDSLKDEDGKYYYLAKRDRKKEVIHKKVKARYLLDLIAHNMFTNAEPGIQNIDIAKKYSNSDYVYDPTDVYNSKIISTNACVTGDTKILTNLGHLPIKTLVGNEVSVWNGKEFSTVTPKLTGENVEVFRVTLDDYSELECNANHMWRINRGNKYKPLEKEIKTSDLVVGDKLFKYHMPVIDFPNNEEFPDAYTHGFYCGDGQTGKKNEKSALLYGEKQLLSSKLKGKITNAEPDAYDRIYIRFSDSIRDKFTVPHKASLTDRLAWLSGLIDADGSSTKNKNSFGIQVASTNLDFLKETKLMLTTLGVQAKIQQMHEARTASMPDGSGGYKDYECRAVFRLLINATDTYNLLILGMKPFRVVLDENAKPNRLANKFVKVIDIQPIGSANVYCFNEPKNHTGCFNGIITSQCSEQYLSEDSLCVLASINAGKFSPILAEYEKELELIAPSVNRFLDNVNECELVYKTYATPKQKLAIEKLRRTGAGYTNLAGWLFKNNLAYGSEEGNDVVAKFTERYNFYLYKSSIELGHLKGSFGLFTKEKFTKSPFVKRMEKLGLVFDAMRSVTCSSLAPTGTLSLLFRESIFSYGIEPAFDMYYWKRTRISGKYEYYFIVPSIVRQLFAEKGFPIPMDSDSIKDDWAGTKGKPIVAFIEKYRAELKINFVNATQVDPFRKLDLMSKVGKWIDSSMSVTYLLPESTKVADVSEFILEAYKKEVKSIAAFPDRQMYGIVTFIPFQELAFKLKSEGVEIHEQNFTEAELAILYEKFNKGNSIVLNDSIIKTNAPRRPTDLPAEVHHITLKGHRYYVAVGLYNRDPYEIFVGDNHNHEGEIIIPKHITEGTIKKESRKNYVLASNGSSFNLSKLNNQGDDSLDAITRMLSTALRHGADISFLVHQLEKTVGGMATFTKVLARVLKKYIEDGTVVHGEICPTCESRSLVRHDGCVQCIDCNWSKCV